VIEPTASGRKWIARLGDRVLCRCTSPFITSARLLLAEGLPADVAIEMCRPNTDEWVLRGRLGAVAATVIDGETASCGAKNGSPARDPDEGAGLRLSSERPKVDRASRPTRAVRERVALRQVSALARG